MPLAYAAGKVVVGPSIGNVGNILKETNNFLFNPEDRESVKSALLNAIEEIKKGDNIGKNNFRYAKTNWNVPVISRTITSYLYELKGRQEEK